MAYAGAPNDQAQLDRILQRIKKLTCPEIDRLHLISSLDKNCSGIVLFAKSSETQLKVKEWIQNDKGIFRYRCICRNLVKEPKGRISIPLIKVLRDQNFKLCPLIETANRNHQLYHLNTDYNLVNENRTAYISLIDAFVRRAISHVVRSHLYYGLDCPIVGDQKYARASLESENVLKTKISANAMSCLNLRMNDLRRMPMFMHLAEVQIPCNADGKFSIVRADPPPFFLYALKKFKLLRK